MLLKVQQNGDFTLEERSYYDNNCKKNATLHRAAGTLIAEQKPNTNTLAISYNFSKNSQTSFDPEITEDLLLSANSKDKFMTGANKTDGFYLNSDKVSTTIIPFFEKKEGTYAGPSLIKQ